MFRREQGRVAVFEVFNDSMKELYVIAASLPLDQLVAEYKRNLPEPISHWGKDNMISYHCLAEEFPAADVEAFIESYARSMSGYKVIRGPDS